MQRQGSFSEAEYAGKKKQTRRDKFLSEMERVVPWSRLVERLRPFYPKGERGRPPIGLERMLRLYFLQQWYGLADEPNSLDLVLGGPLLGPVIKLVLRWLSCATSPARARARCRQQGAQ